MDGLLCQTIFLSRNVVNGINDVFCSVSKAFRVSKFLLNVCHFSSRATNDYLSDEYRHCILVLLEHVKPHLVFHPLRIDILEQI